MDAKKLKRTSTKQKQETLGKFHAQEKTQLPRGSQRKCKVQILVAT